MDGCNLNVMYEMGYSLRRSYGNSSPV